MNHPELSPQRYATGYRQTVVRRTGWRSTLRRAARSTLLSLRACLDRPDDRPFVRCLACHYVFDDQRRDFERLIKMLKQRGDFVDTPTLMEFVNGRPLDGRYFHLSFDDGFKNVIDNALPILADASVPMILFVPPRWVGCDYESARRYAVDIAEYRDVVQMATWDDLRAMIDAGFEIGSHTMTHARLSTLTDDPDRLQGELRQSRAVIERELGTECRFIAYPYGKPGDYDCTTLEQTRAAGYEAGFGIHRGEIDPGRSDRWLLPRHHFEPEWPLRHVRYFAGGGMQQRWAKQLAQAGVAGPND